MRQHLVIAIDGPSGAGKNAVAERVAEELGWNMLDSGAVYRAMAVCQLEDENFDPRTASVLLEGERVYVNGLDVTGRLREEEVSQGASRLAADPVARMQMVSLVQSMLRRGGWVLVGRDTATVLAPQAALKIYLDASAEERARRRAAQSGEPIEQVAEALARRDHRDTTRELHPLKIHPQHTLIDSTDMDLEQVVERVLDLSRVHGLRPRGKLIVLEGPDGSGKSTLAKRLEHRLNKLGIDSTVMREPGGTAVGERVREMVVSADLELGSRAEALLFAASRAQLIEEALTPALIEGTWVILDRFVDSTMVYQSRGRGLPSQRIAQLNDFALNGLSADLTLCLGLTEQEAEQRRRKRGEASDRFEGAVESFRLRVARGYADIRQFNPRAVVIDGNQPVEEVLDEAWQQLGSAFSLTV